MDGICLGGGVVRNTPGSAEVGSGRRIFKFTNQFVYQHLVSNFDTLCPATDFIYTYVSPGRDFDLICTNFYPLSVGDDLEKNFDFHEFGLIILKGDTIRF